MTMKKLAAVALVVATTGASVAAMAEDAHPFYVRGQIGAGRDYVRDTTIVKSSELGGAPAIKLDGTDKAKLAGRVAAGYKINDTFSTELGYTQFSAANGTLKQANTRLSNLDMNSHAVDALVKASFPVTDNISVFGGAGAAYYTTKYEIKSLDNTAHVSTSTSALRPEFTVGSSYKVNENVAIDASFTQIVGKGSLNSSSFLNLLNKKSPNYLPDAQLLAVGVSYSF